MKGLIPPVILNRFLQRQPMCVHYLGQCALDRARKQRPIDCVRFSLRSNRNSSDSNRTLDDEEKDPLVFAKDALGSYIFVGGNASKQYEDPVGISEFIGYHTTPRMKKRQRRRHRCCQVAAAEQGTPKDALFSSGSCEECRLKAEPNFTSASGGVNGTTGNKYMIR